MSQLPFIAEHAGRPGVLYSLGFGEFWGDRRLRVFDWPDWNCTYPLQWWDVFVMPNTAIATNTRPRIVSENHQ